MLVLAFAARHKTSPATTLRVYLRSARLKGERCSSDWLLVRITPSHEGLAPSSPCGVPGSRSPEPEPWDATCPRLRPQEGQQVGVELLLVREGQAVGRPRIDLQ